MTQTATHEKCCPACGGTTGHSHVLTESHTMHGYWGQPAEVGDTGRNVRRSLVKCEDCGMQFRFSSLVEKGLME